MQSKMLYLSSCISYYYKNNEMYKATEWRRKLIKQLQYDIEIKDNQCWLWFDPTHNFEENYHSVGSKTILSQNNFYLDRADILIVDLANLSKSPGTIYEIIYFGLKDKPVIAFNYDDMAKSPHISNFIDCILKEEDIMDYLNAMYYQ